MCNLANEFKKILIIFLQSFSALDKICYWQYSPKFWMNANLLKLGIGKFLLYSDRFSINFNQFFQRLFPVMGETRCYRPVHNAAPPLWASWKATPGTSYVSYWCKLNYIYACTVKPKPCNVFKIKNVSILLYTTSRPRSTPLALLQPNLHGRCRVWWRRWIFKNYSGEFFSEVLNSLGLHYERASIHFILWSRKQRTKQSTYA